MRNGAILLAVVVLTSAWVTLSQPLQCGPCTCLHGNWTLTVECDGDGDVLWDALPHLETWAAFSHRRLFAFHTFPAIWRNLTTNLQIRDSEMQDWDLSGFYVMQKLTVVSVHVSSPGDALQQLPAAVRELSLIDAGLQEVSFPADHRVAIVDLSSNQLTSIPHAEHVTSLNLAGNLVQSVGEVPHCSPMRRLKLLDLSRNLISSLPENAFSCVVGSGNPPLNVNLSGNVIRNIHPTAFAGLTLLKIDLSKNRLRSIDAATLDWPNVAHIDLQMNPWQCQCSAQWMLDELVPTLYTNNPSLMYYLRCDSPKRFKDKALVSWLGHSSDVFCGGPKAYYYTSHDGESVYEVWSATVIACIILSCIIVGLIITIIVVACCLPKKKPTTRGKREHTKYSPIRIISWRK